MVKSSSWCTTSFRTLEPSHCKRVKSMQISKDCLRTFASKDDDSCTGKDRWMAITSGWRCSRDLRLNPSWWVHIEYMRVIQVSEACLFTFVVMATENDKWCSCQCGWMTSSRSWRYSFNLWESPEPFSLYNSKARLIVTFQRDFIINSNRLLLPTFFLLLLLLLFWEALVVISSLSHVLLLLLHVLLFVQLLLLLVHLHFVLSQ